MGVDQNLRYSLRDLGEAANILLGLPSAVARFYRSGEYREGIVFLGDALSKLSESLLGVQKYASESYREFFDKLYRKMGVQPGQEAEGSLVDILERALYSPEPIDREDFLLAVKLFSGILRSIRQAFCSGEAKR